MRSPQTPENQLDPKRWIALAILAAAQFMVVLDASIVNVAIPSIQNDLGFSQENLQWVVSSYTLAFGGFLLLGGRMADLLGRRRMFVGGLLLFSLASLLGGFAQNEGQLIAARAVQGLGAAIISPAALSIVTTTFQEGSERNKALGIWGAIAGAGGAAGVLLGGLLTEYLGWEWVLFVNFPIGIAAALLAPRYVRESRAEADRKAFDAAGAVSITAGLVVLVYALVKANDFGWGSADFISLIAVSAALITAFIVIEMRSKSPLIPLRIFRVRTISATNVIGLLVGASLFAMFYFISLYLQQVLGYSAIETGLAYLPLAVGIIIAAGVASTLVERVGVKPVFLAGLILTVAGLLLFTQVSTDGTYLGDVLIPSVIVAFGLGWSFVPMTISAVSGVSDSEAGLASGLINTSQQVGGALGLAVLSAIAQARTDSVMEAARGAQEALPNALTEGFQNAFAAGAVFAAIGVLVGAFFLKSREVQAQTQTEAEPEGETKSLAPELA